MIDKRYLNWKNKIGYGSGDIAGNVIYAFLSTFMMFYLTDTVGMNMGIVGTLMALSNLLDGITDLLFGTLLDRTRTRLGKARPWMLLGYIGCAAMLAAIFMIPTSWGKTAQYIYFFITYTLLNAVFFTANNIAYATLTALVTKTTSERVQLGSIRFMFAFATTMILQAFTIDAITGMGGNAEAWRTIAVIYAVIGLIANTISALSVKELPPDELYKTDLEVIQMDEKPYTLLEDARLLFSNKYYTMICGVLFLSQLCQSSLNMGLYFMKYVLGNEALLKAFTLFANAPLILGLIIIPWLVRKLRGMYKLNINMLHILYLWAPVILNCAVMILLVSLNVERANAMVFASKIQKYTF
ncbi:MAG: MFS transporter [Oscillospiraceae bacterium]|nr:MFS transporter [Oscillospiraceae bacterium]